MQQGILAQRVGITNSAMSRIESGQQALTLPVLFRLSLALHVPYWHIIEGNVATVERAEDV
jgi:transcriptional regulator with XRE-family HTH domain